jgi:hypothetical protein
VKRFGGSGFQFRVLTKAQRAALEAAPMRQPRRAKTDEERRARKRAHAARLRRLATLGAMVEAATHNTEESE